MQTISVFKDRVAVIANTISGIQRGIDCSHAKITTRDSSINNLNNKLGRNKILFRGIPKNKMKREKILLSV